jgi:hypothetical protein
VPNQNITRTTTLMPRSVSAVGVISVCGADMQE